MSGSKDFTAVIWDMDGIIFDTEKLSFLAWQAGAESVGVEIDLLLFQSLIGMNARTIQSRLLEELGPETDVATLTQEAGVRYDEFIAEGAPLKPGAKACLEFLAQASVPQALATSSSSRYAAKKLEHHDLLRHFQAIVTGDHVEHGKPHPEPYLLAAQKLEVAPARCIAFEDSVNGIQSAKTAGMRTTLVPDMCPHGADSLARVDQQFATLEHALPYLINEFEGKNRKHSR